MKVFCTVIENEGGKFEHLNIIHRFTMDNFTADDKRRKQAIRHIKKKGYIVNRFANVPDDRAEFRNIYVIMRDESVSEMQAVGSAIEEMMTDALRDGTLNAGNFAVGLSDCTVANS